MKRVQLEYFVRIVEEKSFTKAAEKLFKENEEESKARYEGYKKLAEEE